MNTYKRLAKDEVCVIRTRHYGKHGVPAGIKRSARILNRAAKRADARFAFANQDREAAVR